MRIFGPLHLILLAVILVISALLAIACRKQWISPRATRLSVGALLAVNELGWWIYRYSREGVHSANLPLQLCDALVWLSVLACFTLVPVMVEFVYFAGIAGAGLALLTPDLAAPWPSYPAIYFFVAHGGIVVAVLLLAFGGFVHFRPGAVLRSFGLLLCYGVFVGAVDALYGSNYMYLRAKPKGGSPLDWFGPWPWYLAGAAALGLALFVILWVPVRRAGKS